MQPIKINLTLPGGEKSFEVDLKEDDPIEYESLSDLFDDKTSSLVLGIVDTETTFKAYNAKPLLEFFQNEDSKGNELVDPSTLVKVNHVYLFTIRRQHIDGQDKFTPQFIGQRSGIDKERLELFTKATEGDSNAAYKIALDYYKKENKEEAYGWFKIAGNLGNNEADKYVKELKPLFEKKEKPKIDAEELYKTAMIYLDDDNPARASPFMDAAAKAGHPKALEYVTKISEEQGSSSSIDQLPSTQPKDADAMAELGFKLAQENNIPEAKEWLKKAHDLGHPTAIFVLQDLHPQKVKSPEKIRRAVSPTIQKLYQDAASGDARSQHNLAMKLRYGRDGLEQDIDEAIHYYELAANQGFAKAQNNLGWIFEHGIETQKDETRAAALYDLAKEKSQIALCNYARMLAKGSGGLNKDAAEAAKLFAKAYQTDPKVLDALIKTKLVNQDLNAMQKLLFSKGNVVLSTKIRQKLRGKGKE